MDDRRSNADNQPAYLGVHRQAYPSYPAALEDKRTPAAAGNEHIDAYVVGSDQVWRPVFSPCITNYYIDFDQRDHIIRIAYAASFGVDTWEYDRQAQQVCAGYAKKFDAISVREDSGVTLCRNYLGVAAEHVLDPTMLLRREQYEKLATDRHALASRGNLLTYILDPSPEKSTIVGNVSRKLGLTPFSVMPIPGSGRPGTAQCIRKSVLPLR